MSKNLIKANVILVRGSDATKFLQGQLSCDVNALKDGDSTLGAYCNLKGRVEALFRLWREQDKYFMSMPDGILQYTLNELKKYAVFSKVELCILEKEIPLADEEQEIRNNIPQVYPETMGMFFPHDLSLPSLAAVSFNKGCYRGQEIVARMHYRGNLKRSLEFFEIDFPVKPGDNIEGLGKVVRALTANNKTIGLAVVNKQD